MAREQHFFPYLKAHAPAGSNGGGATSSATDSEAGQSATGKLTRTTNGQIAELTEWLLNMTPAEIEILHVVYRVASKMMGEGRQEKGPLNLQTDKRTSRDFLEEARDESADAVFYSVAALIALQGEGDV